MGEIKRLPQTVEEFHDRYKANDVVENEGTPQEIRHLPCLFCGAPDLILLHALRVQEDLERGGTCTDCGRGIRVVFTGDSRRGDVGYEVFQTCGVDAPDYLPIPPRRVS